MVEEDRKLPRWVEIVGWDEERIELEGQRLFKFMKVGFSITLVCSCALAAFTFVYVLFKFDGGGATVKGMVWSCILMPGVACVLLVDACKQARRERSVPALSDGYQLQKGIAVLMGVALLGLHLWMAGATMHWWSWTWQP